MDQYKTDCVGYPTKLCPLDFEMGDYVDHLSLAIILAGYAGIAATWSG